MGADKYKLSEKAIIVAFGWFSLGVKSTITVRPPHASMKDRQDELDELLRHGLITHEHIKTKHGYDDHIFKGTSELQDVLFSDEVIKVLTKLMEK